MLKSLDVKKKTIVVYGVDEGKWLLFKSFVIREKLTVHEALEQAIMLWIEKIKRRYENERE